MHSFDFDRYGFPPPPNPVTGKVPEAKSNTEVAQLILQEMQRLNIEQAIISGPLRNIKEWRGLDSTRFSGGLYYNPRTPLLSLDSFRLEFNRGTFEQIGELGLAYGGLSPNDSSLYDYFDFAERNNIPVGIHMAIGEPDLALQLAPKFRVKNVNPLLIEEVVLKYPKLKIYLMHGGWPFINETKAIMCMFSNVYVDVSVINWILPDEEFQSYIQSLTNMRGVECDLTKKIMYGSDQMIWADAIELSINNIQKIPFLNKEQKADILYNNAKRFFER